MPTRRCRKHLSNGSVFFIAVGVLLTIMLASVLVSRPGDERKSVGQFPSLEPDFPGILPSGSSYDEDAVTEVLFGHSRTSRFVVGFARRNVSDVGVVVWDNTLGQYTLASTLSLTYPGGRVTGVPDIIVVPIGDGDDHMVIARGRTGPSSEATFIFLLSDTVLRVAHVVREDGRPEPAEFHSGPTLDRSETLSLSDVDRDGIVDVIVSYRIDRGGVGEVGKSVYLWRGGSFRYDARLSFALTASMHLFPEPGEGKELDVETMDR